MTTSPQKRTRTDCQSRPSTATTAFSTMVKTGEENQQWTFGIQELNFAIVHPSRKETPGKEKRMTGSQADPNAAAVAREVQRSTDADCVVLFGSRAGAGWTNKSDVDLIVLTDEMPDEDTVLDVQWKAFLITEEVFGRSIGVDVLFMTHEEFRKMSQGNANHVAARALRDGLIMPRDSGEYRHSYSNEHEDEQLRFEERQQRAGDANLHYRNMHVLLDAGMEDKDTAFLAQQALENAMKALITALGETYNTHHSTRAFAGDIRRLDPSQDWHFASNLGQMDNSAGGPGYGPVLTPIRDYRQMANNATEDLDQIYERIRTITGEECWNTVPEGTNTRVQPRSRPER